MELYQVLIKRGDNYVKNEKAFLIRLAKQKLARYYSLLERMKIVVSVNAANEDGEEFDLSDFEIDSFLMEDYAVDQILLDDARKIIQSKPDEVKKVFYLFYDVGLTIPEIAESLSMSESNVKKKLYRTLKELQNLLN